MKWIFLSLVIMFGCAHRPPFVKSHVPVVFMHGLHFSTDVWRDVLKAWPQERPLLTLAIPDRSQDRGMSVMESAQFACGALVNPSVIVAHSFAGVIAQQMVSLCPEKLKQIIYISAITLLPGEKAFVSFTKPEQAHYARGVDMSKDKVTPKSRAQFMVMMEGEGYKFDALWPAIYSEDGTLGSKAISYNQQVWQKIPKAYVITTKDLIIQPNSQKGYIQKGDIKVTREIHSGHLPMVSHPKELTEILAQLCLI